MPPFPIENFSTTHTQNPIEQTRRNKLKKEIIYSFGNWKMKALQNDQILVKTPASKTFILALKNCI